MTLSQMNIIGSFDIFVEDLPQSVELDENLQNTPKCVLRDVVNILFLLQ